MIFLLLFSCLFGSFSYSQDDLKQKLQSEKIEQKPCSFDSIHFKQVMRSVQKDYDLTLSNQRLSDTVRSATNYYDYRFKTRSQYKLVYKDAVYIGSVKYNDNAKKSISYDASLEKINYIMACTVYFIDNNWVILDANRISPPTRPSGVYSSFGEKREITIEPPTAPIDTRQYSLLIYEKESLEVENMPDGFSLYLTPPYTAYGPWYDQDISFTVPKEIKPYVKQYDLEKTPIKNYVLLEKTTDDLAIYFFGLKETSFEKELPGSYTLDNGTFPYIGFSTFESWPSVNKYLDDIYEPIIRAGEKDITGELELIAKENSIDKGQITPEQIYYHVVKLYRYVSDHQGSGAYVPNPVSVTIKNKSGDCKDLAILAITLLRAAGYNSFPVILRTNSGYNYDLDIPGMVFDHMIARYIDKDGKDHFLDLTTQGSVSFGMLPEMDLDRNYISYTDVKSSGATVFKGRTPDSNLSSTDIRYEYNISEDKKEEKLSCLISVKSEYCGEDAYSFYNNYSGTPLDRRADYVKDCLSSKDAPCNMEEYAILEFTPDHISLSAKLNQDDAIILYNNDTIEITPSVISVWDLSNLDKNQHRCLACKYSDQNMTGPYERSIIYNIPQDFQIEYIPEPFEYHSPYLDLLVKFEKINDGKQIKLSRSVIYNEHIIPADKFLEEQKHMRAIYNYKNKRELVLRKKS